jgi:hypothetical protein
VETKKTPGVKKVKGATHIGRHRKKIMLLWTVKNKRSYKIGMNSTGITFVPDFVKTDQMVQKEKWVHPISKVITEI